MEKNIKIAMFDTKSYDKESFEKIKDLYQNIKIDYFETKLDNTTVKLAKGYDGVIIFVNDDVNEQVVKKLYESGVRLIALRCAGFNNVDVKTSFGKIHVLRVPAYSPYAVAEHAIAMLLTSVRRIHKAYNRTREYNFSIAGLTGFDLYGKTVGIVGTGKIGRIFADICNGFKMKVIAYDKFPIQSDNITYVDLETLFKESDIISLHCPLTDENYHLINNKTIDLMKKGVIILNTSRGALIDADSLLEGIKNKKIGGACLDVYEEESDLFFDDKSGHILKDDVLARLLSMPNVIVTSHQAFLTNEALDNIAHTTYDNIKCFFAGEDSENEVCYKCSMFKECKNKHNRVNKRCF